MVAKCATCGSQHLRPGKTATQANAANAQNGIRSPFFQNPWCVWQNNTCAKVRKSISRASLKPVNGRTNPARTVKQPRLNNGPRRIGPAIYGFQAGPRYRFSNLCAGIVLPHAPRVLKKWRPNAILCVRGVRLCCGLSRSQMLRSAGCTLCHHWGNCAPLGRGPNSRSKLPCLRIQPFYAPTNLVSCVNLTPFYDDE